LRNNYADQEECNDRHPEKYFFVIDLHRIKLNNFKGKKRACKASSF